MTGGELYIEFKDALDYLGPGFTGMAEVEVTLEAGGLCLAVEDRKCVIRIPSKTDKGEGNE